MIRLLILLALGTSLTLSAERLNAAQLSQEEPLGDAEEHETVPGEAVPVEKFELTEDIARKAIDAFMLVENK
jgi:hypothetical protein